jgi:trans-aconitate 2-methyltransferase
LPSWDPGQYLRFADERHRPSWDLLARIDSTPHIVWDLGCGSGEVTTHLARRWPAAAVYGLDSSRQMLDRARAIRGITWVEGDIATWSPAGAVDLIVATASLHWVPDHAPLLTRLLGFLSPGGILAVQMPNNFAEPSHTELAAVANASRWRDRVGHLVGPSPVAAAGWYHRLLRSLATEVSVWETTYHQVLTGADPIAEWMRGTAGRPYLDTLGDDGAAFLNDYAVAVRPHYPPEPDGTTLFPFRRLFFVARK